ncbi:hypothetical protein H5410_029040 [Solanum commersonii]|uniref:Uncharacterized protein n=1 Tax=Solanum commersonii TaxID=4109 RepID=A0A9J5Z7W3_SOLCO|nr:hypothetical protein H5410_029040 [Solanum commersonii]
MNNHWHSNLKDESELPIAEGLRSLVPCELAWRIRIKERRNDLCSLIRLCFDGVHHDQCQRRDVAAGSALVMEQSF